MRILGLLLVLVSLSSFASQKVSFYEASLRDLVEFSSPIIGRPVVVGADTSAVPISVFAAFNTPADLALILRNTVESAGLYYSDSGNAIRISANPIIDQLESDTHVIQLQNLQADYAVKSLTGMISALSSSNDPDKKAFPLVVTASPTTNSVIVTGALDQVSAVRRVLGEIDTARRQVVVTAVIAEISDEDFESLGLNVGGSVGGDNHTASLAASTIRQGSDLGLSLTFNGPTLSAFLRAVQSTGRSRVLSTPQLLTLNRETASIVVGQNVPFITGETTSGATPASDPFRTITRQDVGVTLTVRPLITPSGSIELDVQQTASSVSSDMSAADIITNTRKISTVVQLQDGGGVLLGGLRSVESSDSSSSVPFLSDLPGIGRLFRFDSSSKRGTNLVVLISARIHSDADSVAVRDSVRDQLPALLSAD